jgi:hypothetical protein
MSSDSLLTTAEHPIPLGEVAALTPLETAAARADALCRTAIESCHQHERLARLFQVGALEAEMRTSYAMVRRCDEALAAMRDSYEKCATRLQPDKDVLWWNKANALWLATREYLRRSSLSDIIARHMTDHSSGALAEMHLDFEIEASALLGLKHAFSDYAKARGNEVWGAKRD